LFGWILYVIPGGAVLVSFADASDDALASAPNAFTVGSTSFNLHGYNFSVERVKAS